MHDLLRSTNYKGIDMLCPFIVSWVKYGDILNQTNIIIMIIVVWPMRFYLIFDVLIRHPRITTKEELKTVHQLPF